MGGNIQIRISLKTSVMDVQSARVLSICFLGYFLTQDVAQNMDLLHSMPYTVDTIEDLRTQIRRVTAVQCTLVNLE